MGLFPEATELSHTRFARDAEGAEVCFLLQNIAFADAK
jgi:hypothetical protein